MSALPTEYADMIHWVLDNLVLNNEEGEDEEEELPCLVLLFILLHLSSMLKIII